MDGFNFSFTSDAELCTQHLEASKHYRDLVIMEAREPEGWTDEDDTKIQRVFNYILALVNEMQKREQEREADIAAAVAMEEHEFDQDDFEAERQMEGCGSAGAGGAEEPTDAGASWNPTNRWIPTMLELLGMPPERQIHYCCNVCDKPALADSFYPGRYCTWDCYTKDCIH